MKIRCIDCGKEISRQEAYGRPISIEERLSSGAYAVYKNAYCFNCAKNKDFETYQLAENSFEEVSLSWQEWRYSMLYGAVLTAIIIVILFIFDKSIEADDSRGKLLFTLLGFFAALFHVYTRRGNQSLWSTTQVTAFIILQPIFIYSIVFILFKLLSLL